MASFNTVRDKWWKCLSKKGKPSCTVKCSAIFNYK